MNRNQSTLARIVLVSMTLFATAANAAELTLLEAQQTAAQHSPELGQMQADVNIAQAGVDKARAPRLPQVYANGRHILDDKPQVMEINLGSGPTQFPLVQPYSDYAVGVSLLLFDGKGARNNYQSAKLQYDASSARLELARFKLDEEVRIRFYQVLGADALVTASSQNVEVLKVHLGDVQNQVRLGTLTRFDKLKIEVQLNDAQNDLDAAKDEAHLARARLAQAMGVEQLPGELQGQLPVLTRAAYDRIDFTPGERLDQKALNYIKQSAEYNVKASHSTSWPRLTLYGQQDMYSYKSKSIVPDNQFGDAHTVGLSFTWNLYDGGAQSASRRIALEQLKKQQEQIRQANQSIPVDIDFWKRKLAHDISRYQAGLVSTQKSEEAVRLAREGMRLGARTSTDVLDAERDLNQSRLKVVRAQVDSGVSLSNLELALGKRLESVNPERTRSD